MYLDCTPLLSGGIFEASHPTYCCPLNNRRPTVAQLFPQYRFLITQEERNPLIISQISAYYTRMVYETTDEVHPFMILSTYTALTVDVCHHADVLCVLILYCRQSQKTVALASCGNSAELKRAE